MKWALNSLWYAGLFLDSALSVHAKSIVENRHKPWLQHDGKPESYHRPILIYNDVIFLGDLLTITSLPHFMKLHRLFNG